MLANIATRLLEFNRRVCLLDFDLEAPGLPAKFNHLAHHINIEKGIVDYIHRFTNEGVLPPSIMDYILTYPTYRNNGSLHLIPAGNTDSKVYWQKLSSIHWHDFLYKDKQGIAFFLDLKEKIRKEIRPDFLLIDARTGISEMSGITISLLADEVVIVAANNQENLEGAKKVIRSLSDTDGSVLGVSPKVTFVLSRIPFTDKPEDRARERHLLMKVKEELPVDEISVIHSDRELEEAERIRIGDENNGRVAQISKDYLGLFERITGSELTVEEVRRFSDIKESEKMYEKAARAETPEEGLVYISRALDLNPHNLSFYLLRGRFYEMLGSFDEAERDYQLILPSFKHTFIPQKRLAKVAFKKKHYEESERLYREVLTDDTQRYDACLGLGLLHDAQGRYAEALSWYADAIAIDAGFAVVYNNRANTYMHMREYDLALQDVYKAIELDADDAVFYATLAEIKAYLGNTHEFYLNLELGLKINKKEVAAAIQGEDIYRLFLKEDRFQRLMEKYNVGL